MKRTIIVFSVFFVFILISWLLEFNLGLDMGRSFLDFAFSLIKIVPFAFILIGLFEVWIKKETVEKHLGENSVFKGYFWAIVLASTTVGGLFVALPVSAALSRKGARLGLIIVYLSASAVCRLPMILFESSFLGIKFTLIRYLVSIPLVIITSEFMAKVMPGLKIQEN